MSGSASLSDEQFRRIVAQAHPGIVITEAEPLDEPGPRIVYVNTAFTTMTGYSAEEALGRSPRMLQGPKTEEHLRAQIRRALEAREPTDVELSNVRKGGAPFVAEMIISPAFDADGRCTHFIAVQKDVTVRRNMASMASELAEEDSGVSDVLSSAVEVREQEHDWLDRAFEQGVGGAGVATAPGIDWDDVVGGGEVETLETAVAKLRRAGDLVRHALDHVAAPGPEQSLGTSLTRLAERTARAISVPITVEWRREPAMTAASATAVYGMVRDLVMAGPMAGAVSAMAIRGTDEPATITVELAGVAERAAAGDAVAAAVRAGSEELVARHMGVGVDRTGTTVTAEIRPTAA